MKNKAMMLSYNLKLCYKTEAMKWDNIFIWSSAEHKVISNTFSLLLLSSCSMKEHLHLQEVT